MAPPADLAQIGKEGFDLIERVCGRRSRHDNSHEEPENHHFKHQPLIQSCTYHRPEPPLVTERLPVSSQILYHPSQNHQKNNQSQPHHVVVRANDVTPGPQPFHPNYVNPNPNANARPQPMPFYDFGQVHPGPGRVQDYVGMDSTRFAMLYRGVAKVELRWIN